jgi:hypothetical protein
MPFNHRECVEALHLELMQERTLRIQLSEDSQRHLDRALVAEARLEGGRVS